MLPYRALWSNYDFACSVLGKIINKGDNVISILPMAHMYGMAFEFMYEFLHGCHTFYLNRTPSPAIIAQAFADIKPRIIIAVPLVIEKIIRKKELYRRDCLAVGYQGQCGAGVLHPVPVDNNRGDAQNPELSFQDFP